LAFGGRAAFSAGPSSDGFEPLFFIVWWLTAGADLIVTALEFASFADVALMCLRQIWIDYVWLTVTRHFAKVGLNFVGLRW
jgi:hypothetical protein